MYTGYIHKYAGMIKGTMNTTTNLFILLIMTLFIFAATTIRYAQAQPGCCEPATTPRPTPGVGGTVASLSRIMPHHLAGLQQVTILEMPQD